MARKFLLTGQGTAYSQISSDELGGGGTPFTGLPIKQDGTLIGSATILNFAGNNPGTLPAPFVVTVDGVVAGQINIALYERVSTPVAVDAGALIKNSGNGTYAMLAAGDNPRLMRGIAVTASSGGFAYVCFIPGIVCSTLSDGTGTIAQGAYVIPSTTVAGRVKEGTSSDVYVGINVGAAVAASLNASCTVR